MNKRLLVVNFMIAVMIAVVLASCGIAETTHPATSANQGKARTPISTQEPVFSDLIGMDFSDAVERMNNKGWDFRTSYDCGEYASICAYHDAQGMLFGINNDPVDSFAVLWEMDNITDEAGDTTMRFFDDAGISESCNEQMPTEALALLNDGGGNTSYSCDGRAYWIDVDLTNLVNFFHVK